MRRHPRIIFTITLATVCVAGAVAFSGCSWWHNFSTYFNTVYLAQTHLEAYEAQQRAIVAQNANGAVAILNHRWFDEEYLMRQVGMHSGHVDPITPSFSQSLSATKQVTNVHLDSAIILGSKILADKKANKYKEDALFIVGKAQFYKNDFIGAERKFRELLANYPQTKYGAQVQVYLARSMLVNHDIDTAAMQLESSLAASADAKDVPTASAIHRAMAELIYAKNPDSLTAIATELHKAEAGLSGEDLARLAYQEGAVEYLNGDWPAAGSAFQVAANNSSDDWLSGEAHVAHALTLREAGNLDGSKSELTSVIAHVKYGGSAVAARFELAYTDELIARKAVGNDLRSTAWSDTYEHPVLLEYHILDTTYKNSSALMISRAKFRQAEIFREMGLYDTAARLAAGLIGTKDFSSTAMNEYVSEHANSLVSYAQWHQELIHIDTLQASLQKGTSHTHGDVKIAGQVDDEATIHLKAVQEVLGTRFRPEVPPQLTKYDSERVKDVEARMKKNVPAKLVVSDTTHFIDSLRFRAGSAHYELGRAYETFGEIPEAREEYRAADTMSIGPMDTGRTALRARTLYAWLELEKQEKNKIVSDSLLHELLSKYGQTMYAEQARILYVTSSRNSPAELAYLAAYKALRNNGLEAAKPAMLQLVVNYSQEDVAPRSLYALGVSYEEVPRYDSALAYYKRVLKEYPYSSYALALRPRLADASTPGLPHVPPPRSIRSGQSNEDSTSSTNQVPPGPRQFHPGMQQNPGNNPQHPGVPSSQMPHMPPGTVPPVPPPMPPQPSGTIPPPPQQPVDPATIH
jgi:TolA-binding protein